MATKKLFAIAHTLLALSAGVLTCGTAQAQDYPNRVVRLVVPSPPGGGTDITARILAMHLSQRLGQQFVVENRPGAGNIIGIETVARSTPDGYTLLMAPSTLVLNGIMNKKVSYDALRDFAPITVAASLSNVLLVNNDVKAKNMAELIALAKKSPGELNYGTPGVGTSPHMSMELLKSLANIDMMHIPYRGTAPAVTDLIAGRITATFANMLTAKPTIDNGQARAIAVSGPKRSETMPDLPTIAESGVPGYEAVQWYGLLAPAGTPEAIIKLLHAESVKILHLPETKAKMATDGAEPVGNTPAEFTALIKSDLEKWTAVAKKAGIEPQ